MLSSCRGRASWCWRPLNGRRSAPGWKTEIADIPRLDLTALSAAYASGETPAAVVARIYDKIESEPLHPVWISTVPRDQALARAGALEDADRAKLPLYGVPF